METQDETAMASAALREELEQRIVYAFLQPAARLSLLFGRGAKDVREWLEVALFHETRRAGLKLREASELLDVSMRKVARLSKLLKTAFMQADADYALPRRIEFILWAEPLSEARIFQALEDVDDPDEVAEALARLMDEGRVERQVGRTVTYAVAAPERRLVRDQWMARVDALGNLLSNLLNAVYARFFDEHEHAFARTLSLRARPGDVGRLRALYEETIWPELVAIDAAAKDDPEAVALDVSLLWAPYEYVKRQMADNQEEDA